MSCRATRTVPGGDSFGEGRSSQFMADSQRLQPRLDIFIRFQISKVTGRAEGCRPARGRSQRSRPLDGRKSLDIFHGNNRSALCGVALA